MLVLCGPFTPMLFMGEEWAASTPFPYFCGPRDPGLDDAVRRGRRDEFAGFGWTRRPSPTPLPTRPSSRPCSGGPRSTSHDTRRCSTGTASAAVAPRAPRVRPILVRLGVGRRRRSFPHIDDEPFLALGRREPRPRRACRRSGSRSTVCGSARRRACTSRTARMTLPAGSVGGPGVTGALVATYRCSSDPGFGFAETPADRRPISPARRLAPLPVAGVRRPRRAAPTATTSSTTAGSEPSSAAATAFAGWSARPRTRARDRARHRAAPHGGGTRRTRGGGRCSSSARTARTRRTSTSTGTRRAPAPRARPAARARRPLRPGARGRRAAARAAAERTRSSLATTTTSRRSRPTPPTSCGPIAGRRADRRSTRCSTEVNAESTGSTPSSIASTTGSRAGRPPPHELDYRRFFDVDRSSRCGARRPRSSTTPPAACSSSRDGTVDGLRIDHVDGLRDPAGYLERLARSRRRRGSW